MPAFNKRWEQLTYEDKALLDSSTLNLILFTDPYIFMDIYGLSDPIKLNVGFLVCNREPANLYFQATGSSSVSDYDFPVTNLGSISSDMCKFLEYSFTRKKPSLSSPTTETLSIILRAYTDSEYTQLYGEEQLQYTVELFDRSTGTIIDMDDFESDLEGWTNNGFYSVERDTKHAYLGSYSLHLKAYNSPGDAPSIDSLTPESDGRHIYKSLDTSSYTKVYAILHFFYGYNQNPVQGRIVIYGGDNIVRFKLPHNQFKWFRVSYRMPIDSSATIKVWCDGSNYSNVNNGHMWMDYVIFVGW